MVHQKSNIHKRADGCTIICGRHCYSIYCLLSKSEVREWRHDSDKTHTSKLEWWMILKISLKAKAGFPKTLVKQNLSLHSLYFPQNTLMLTESRREFSDLQILFLDFLRFAISTTGYSCMYGPRAEHLVFDVKQQESHRISVWKFYMYSF